MRVKVIDRGGFGIAVELTHPVKIRVLLCATGVFILGAENSSANK